ncbi:trimeric intracellular cation channel family protein [Coprobacter sp.]
MDSTFVSIIEIIGTLAFAISGIRLASAKQFDWFGAYVVGLVTAIGGGTLRDVLLNIPSFWMQDSVYLIVTGVALIAVIVLGKFLIKLQNTFFVFDTIGLALFVVVGIQKTLLVGYPFWVAIVMGTITGAFGGIIRDILINEEPLVFRKDIYALACVIGGVFYWIGFLLQLPDEITQSVAAASVIITRFAAVKYHWGLPVLHGDDDA